jgi:2,4-dienoyl-CoA reductase-like NADH-dependent reductase (Old Yellow Enzyme family)
MVIAEASAVLPEGRISPHDLGIWSDDHVPPLERVARFLREQGVVPAIQLAHAGRKAATARPWEGGRPLSLDASGWPVVGPSAIPFGEGYQSPRALDGPGMERVIEGFAAAAGRARAAGFEAIEIHAAHGYLLHQFLSPLSNRRKDAYGGSLAHRMRLLLEVVETVRRRWPDELPLLVRVSTTDWVPGGWDLQQCTALARELQARGVDLLDCSSGGSSPQQHVSLGPGYQVPNTAHIRRETGIPVAAVGLITAPEYADAIVRQGHADAVAIARASLRDPYWPLHAAQQLHADITYWPAQYLRAR